MSKGKKFTKKDFYSILLIIVSGLTIRAVLIEPYKIPSASMVPTLMIGDHIFVNKLAYGVRVPFTNIYLKEFKNPERGEVVVFRNPDPNDNRSFIKRVIGLPGDKIEYDGLHVKVNGRMFTLNELGVEKESREKKELIVSDENSSYPVPKFPNWEHFVFYEEEIDGHKHLMQDDRLIIRDSGTYEVPEGHFFVMGDNRDSSHDSRGWGTLPRAFLRGKATYIWVSWDPDEKEVRWQRFGRAIE